MNFFQTHKPVKQLNGFSLYFSDDIAVILIDKGENRINKEFLETLNTFLDEVERNESCKGLITTGQGKFYGNGLDLEWFGALSQKDVKDFLILFETTLKRLLCFPLPTLAAINGHAFAGGALFAFAHDLRTVKIGKGWTSFNEVFISKFFSKFHVRLLKIKLGMGKNLTDALVLGRRYTAEEAFAGGLVHAIQNEVMLITESLRVLRAHFGKTGYPRDSLKTMKEAVYVEALDAFNEVIQEFAESKL